MSDSVKFGRINDPGYLVARLLVNLENRFIMEGQNGLNGMFSTISQYTIMFDNLNEVVQHALMIAIDNDLIAPPFPEVRSITT